MSGYEGDFRTGTVTADGLKKIWEKKGFVILFFALFFLYGCAVFRDYGIGVDEPVERRSSLITWLHLHPSVGDLVTDTVDFSQLQPLEEYQDRYYGVAVMLPCVAAEHLTGFSMPLSDVYEMRHFYNFLLFFAGSIFFYLLCRELGFGEGSALLGVLFLVLSPRILAESFYNLKDLVFLSLFIIALYFGIRFLNDSTIGNTVGLALSAALCANTRMIGAYLPVLCLLSALAKAFFRGETAEKERAEGYLSGRAPGWARQLVFCLAAGVLCLAFYILITPITWDNPVGRMKEIVEHFLNYSVWDDYNFYMGRYITREEIPWHYLPVWMGISIPAVTLILAVGGFCTETVKLAVAGLFCGKAKAAKSGVFERKLFRERLLVWLLAVIPLAYAAAMRPTMYNGWRHFYFIYPLFCLFALFFVDDCRKWLGRKTERTRTLGLCFLWGGIAAGFLCTVLWIGRNHPYDYIYFNGPARAWAMPRFDKDYWGVSEKDALNAICARDRREEIKIFLLTDFSLPLLAQEDRDRINRVGTMEEAEYYIHGYHAGALGGLPEGSEGMKPWYQIRVDGDPVRTVYKRE